MIVAILRHCRSRLLLVLPIAFSWNCSVRALPPIESPPPPLPTDSEIPLPPASPVEILSPPTPTPVPEGEFPAEISETIVVKQFRFVGNTAFSDRQLAEVTKSFTDRPLTFTELLDARSAVTQYYISSGYATSGAYIPPQEIAGGTVTIAIVEGALEAIQVEVEGKLNPDYVRDRVALAAGVPLNLTRLLQALQLLQLDPLIAKISANLSASPHPGKSILDISVRAAPSFQAQAILDNGRSPQVGSFRRGVQLQEANLTGWGDKLRGIYLNSDGTNDLEVTYTLPFNPHNGTVGLRFRTIASEIIEPPLNAADISSDYQEYEFQLRQPVLQSPQQELSLGLGFHLQKSQSFFGLLPDSPFLVTSGTNEQGLTRVTTFQLFQEWLQRSDRHLFAARSEFDWGIDAFGVTDSFDAQVNPNALNNRFFLWRSQFQWVYRLAPDTLLIALADLQLADRPVVSLERFALGGLGSVRGYRQNTLLTDNGIFASVELRLPLLRLPQEEAVLQIVPFADFGSGWNADGFTPQPTTLASLGLGLQWQQGSRLSARLDWGIPLGKVPFQGDTWQDQGLLFRIIFSP